MVRAWRQGVLAALVGVLPVSALAQEGVAQRDVARGVTVLNRPRPEFDPLGMRVGGFRIEGALEAGAGFDSNVFGRHSNVKSSGYATEAASVSVNSDWTQHAMGASANMSSRQYFSQGTLDWQDWGVGGFGRYDFSAQTNVEGRYRHSREHLDVYNFDVQAAGIVKPVPYDSDEFQVTGSTRINRLGLLATGLYRTYRFEDVTIGGVRNRISQQSFNSAIGAFGASYALADGRFVTAVVRFQDISYLQAVSSGRNSFTYEALLGFQYDFDGVWQGKIAVGWRHRDYQSSTIKPLEGLAAEGTLAWSPTRLTTVSFNLARTIEESIRAAAVSYTRTTGGFAVDHEFMRNVILHGDIRAENRAYQSPNQTATDLVFTAGARWLINRNLSLNGQYSYARRIETSGGIPIYDRHIMELRLRAAL